MRKFILLGVLFALTTLFGQLAIAQLSVDNLDQTYTIDFDNTVAGVNEDVFNGSGFATTPAAGQLDADAWAVDGMSDGTKPFGVENTTGDHARGTSTGGETTGGVWAFEVEPGNYALGVQPGTSDFTPGYFGFVLQNNSGSDVNFIEFSYDIWVYNDADRANSFNGEFSLDGINWAPIPELEFTTTELLDNPVAWEKTEMMVSGFFGAVLPDGGYLYFRWNADDVSGSGSRDEIGLDNIQVTLSFKNLVTSFPFVETFEESSTTRGDWTQIQEQGNKTWTFVAGDGGGTIATAYEGSLNAKFTSSTYAGDKTKLVSPFMDLSSTLVQPMLTFWYGQNAWGADQNELKVYYRTDVSEPWIELAHYVDNVDVWTEVTLALPNPSSGYQIAFEGIDYYGYANVVDLVTIKETPTATPDWCNLQHPPAMEISDAGTGTVYARVYEPGVTEDMGQGAGIEAWIGYSVDNTHPATWTNWVPATYNSDNGNNDEYMADLGPLPLGTYYYASGFRLDGGPMVYGGYNETGGNFWDGIDNVSGILTVVANVYSLPLFEDFELGFSYFANPAKSTDWTLNTSVYYSGAQSAHNDYAANDDNVLYQTGNIDLSATANPELSFWQIAKTEGDYDFCYIEVSTDGGATWNIIPETAYMGDGVYEVAGFSAEGFCFDEDAYAEWGTGTQTPDNTWWKKEVFSLADYATSSEFRVRFRLNSDVSSQRAGWYLDDIMIKDVTCPNPTDLAANNITAMDVDISWTAGDTETLWNLLYGPTGFDILNDGTLETGVGNPYNISTLTESTTYDVYVQADCSGGDLSEWVGPVTFTTLANCPEPTDLAAANIGLTTADLSWTAATGTDTWNAEVGAVGFTPGNSEELFSDIGNTTAAWALSGLTEGTDYQLYVQTDCGGGITSTWAGPYDFSTLAPGASCETALDYGTVNDPEVTGAMETGGFVWYYVTLAEDYADVDISLCGSDFDTKLAVFEDCADFVSIPSFGAPDGTLAYNDDAPGTYCSVDLNQSLVEFDVLPAGTYYILVYPYGSNSGTYGLEITGITCAAPTDLAAGNITQTSAEISWTQGLNETLWNVLYGPTGFDILNEGTQVDGVTSPYEINTLTENSTYDVYVQSDCGGGDYSDWAGPVTFTTLAGCAEPINLYAADITSESANLGWEAVGGTDTWNVELGLPGFTPGNGEELVLVTETNDNPVFVDGGTPNTTYQFYVQSVCGAETSSWAGPFEFTSECETVATFPFTENFDGDWTTWCWDVINEDGDANTWTQNNTYITPTHSTPYAAHGMGNQDDYLITPALLLDDNMIMTWWDKVESSSYPNRYYVKLSTTGKNPADFTEELGYFECTNTAWTQHDIDLSTYSGQTVYIAFHQVYSQSAGWGFGIDDFEIRQLSDENDIIEFVLADQTGPAVITGAPDYTVDIEVAMGTDMNGLIPTITVSPFATIDPESGVPQDFNSPVVYTVISEAGTAQEWTVNVTESTTLSNENDIVDFVLPEQTGAAVIMGDPDYTVEIEVVWNADIANLTPTIVVSPLATISPESGVTQDFTNPVIYTVTAEDGTEQEWTVTVTQEEPPAGITCDDPIVVSIPAEAPYLDEDQSNCGFGANYTETCLGSYDGGDGIVYLLDVTEASYVYIDLTTTSTWTGIALLDDCPDVGECITYETGSSGNESIEAALMPGSYYILISTFPTPDCIPSFDLAITVDNNVCLVPVGLAVVDLWQDEVTIEWEAGFLETSFNILYGETGFDPETEGTLISGVTSPYTIESLTASTEYDVYVQADCDSDWTSISFTTLAACPAPIDLYADNITHESADLGWNAVGGTDTWNVEYGEAGFTQGEGTLISATTDNPVYVDGLEQDTEYQFYVQSVCGAENSAWAGPFSFTTLEACPTPDELYAINVTTESADLGWLETGVATEWNVEVGAPGFAVGTGAEIVGVMGTIDNPVFVDGLTPATTYEFYVQADCGEAQSYWAGPFEFATLCETFELPFEEDFTDVATGALPLCWTETNTHWGVVASENAGGVTPEMKLNWSPSVTEAIKLITPVINANDVVELDLSFLHMIDHYSNSYDVRVEISTNYGTDWTEVWSQNVTGDVVAETIEVNLDAYAGNDIMLAWVFDGYTFYINGWYIDNINLTGVEPVFPEITGIDINSDVVDASVCLGALESEALAQLVEEITISDSDGGEHVVAVSWTIDSYDGDVADTYTATGTFALPDGVVQTDPETTLEVYADVVVNELPVVTCPDDFTVTTAEPVVLTGENPEGGVYSGTGVTDGTFDPDGLVNDDYVITYTYEDPATGCENFCEFIITVNIDINIESNSLSQISIYPNPNNGLFVMDLSNIEGKVYYQIYDTKGSVIMSNEFVNYGGVEEFSLDVAPGIYYIQLRNAEQTINKKIVVQ